MVCADLNQNSPKRDSEADTATTSATSIPTHEVITSKVADPTRVEPAAIFVKCNTTSSASVEALISRCVEQYNSGLCLG